MDLGGAGRARAPSISKNKKKILGKNKIIKSKNKI
jgi:hypothetical protein